MNNQLKEAVKSYVSDVSKGQRTDEIVGELAALTALGLGGYYGGKLLNKGYKKAKQTAKDFAGAELTQDALKAGKAGAKGLGWAAKKGFKGASWAAKKGYEKGAPLVAKGAGWAGKQIKDKGPKAIDWIKKNLAKKQQSRQPQVPVDKDEDEFTGAPI